MPMLMGLEGKGWGVGVPRLQLGGRGSRFGWLLRLLSRLLVLRPGRPRLMVVGGLVPDQLSNSMYVPRLERV